MVVLKCAQYYQITYLIEYQPNNTAKQHKLKKSSSLDDLPLRPIISNVGTASYQLAKCPAKLLSPLRKSQYTVNSTKEFIDIITNCTDSYIGETARRLSELVMDHAGRAQSFIPLDTV